MLRFAIKRINVKFVTELIGILDMYRKNLVGHLQSNLEKGQMSTQEQARALMMRHHKLIKNRQQSMLGRAAAEIGLDVEGTDYWSNIQGKHIPSFRQTYDRSNVSLS